MSNAEDITDMSPKIRAHAKTPIPILIYLLTDDEIDKEISPAFFAAGRRRITP